MLVEFSIVPIGSGVSLGSTVAGAVDIVDKSGLPYRLTPMGTVVEGEWDEVMLLLKRCHAAAMAGNQRCLTSVKIDDRRDRKTAIADKIASVERRLGHTVKT